MHANLTHLTIDELATLLRKSGSQQCNHTSIQKDIEHGAPTNTDGTLNFMTYSAWIIKECAHGS